MSEEQLTELVGRTGAVSLGAGFVLLLLTVTLFFRKTVEVERRIATPGKQLDEIRSIWERSISHPVWLIG
ncbi:MAG: hypothetical protein ACQEV6_01555 [Pseudomonadota bacterium]